MTVRIPLVLASDGGIQQLQSGDTLQLYETFAQGRWLHCDFDSASGGGVSTSAISAGTISYTYGSKNVYGQINISSSTNANSGYATGWLSTQCYVQQGNIYRCIAALTAAQSTRTVRMGWLGIANASTVPTGAWFEVTGSTVVANFKSGAENQTVGSYTLANDNWYVFDIEVLTNLTVRYVIWDFVNGTKVFDQIITAANNLAGSANNSPLGWPLIVAYSSGTTAIALVSADYIGRGVGRPAHIVTPA